MLHKATVPIALLCILGCAHTTPAKVREVTAHHSIVVFGDSLALGTGASDAAHGFTFVLFRHVLANDPSAQITSYAVGGAKVADVTADQVPQAKSSSPTDVWICVGGNDVTHGTSEEQFAMNEKTLLRSVRLHWPDARIVVFGVPDVSRSALFAGMTRLVLHRLAAADNDATYAAARDAGADFVDLYKFSERVMDVDRDLSADNFHPNDRGHVAIANFAERTLNSF